MKCFIFALIIAGTLRLLPRGKDVMGTCEELKGKLPDGPVEEMLGLLDEDDARAQREFLRRTGGMQGLMDRLRVASMYLRIIQAHRREGIIDISDAYCIWKKVVALLFFTLIALPEAATWNTRHRAARKAAGFYCDLLLCVNTICFSATCNKCPISLPSLL